MNNCAARGIRGGCRLAELLHDFGSERVQVAAVLGYVIANLDAHTRLLFS